MAGLFRQGEYPNTNSLTWMTRTLFWGARFWLALTAGVARAILLKEESKPD